MSISSATKPLHVSVRTNPDGRFELFYYDYALDNPAKYWIESFCMEEGHNEATLGYMYKCKPATCDESRAFVERWENMILNTNIKIVKRLKRPL